MAALLLNAVTDMVIATPYSLTQTASSISSPISRLVESIQGVPVYLNVVAGTSANVSSSLSTGILRSGTCSTRGTTVTRVARTPCVSLVRPMMMSPSADTFLPI